VVPDLNHLSIREPEDVDGRKLSPLAGGFDAAPRPRIRASSSPASRYQIAFSQDQIDTELQVRKGSPKVGCDLALSFGTGESLGGAEVMADAVLCKDLRDAPEKKGSAYTCPRCSMFHISSRQFTVWRKKGRGKSRRNLVGMAR
jgi:hypothetical protein